MGKWVFLLEFSVFEIEEGGVLTWADGGWTYSYTNVVQILVNWSLSVNLAVQTEESERNYSLTELLLTALSILLKVA